MKERLSRREFLAGVARYGAAMSALGGVIDAIAASAQTQTRASTPRWRLMKATGSQAAPHLRLAPDLAFAPPRYDSRLRPVRVLTEWNPTSDRFLRRQNDYAGKVEPGNTFVVTLVNRSEGAAFDTVAEIFALVADWDGRRLRDVIKFERMGSAIADVPSNRTQDFAVPITWTNERAWHVPLGKRRRGSVSYAARFWHPVFDPAPLTYVHGDRHFWQYFLAVVAGAR